MTRQTKRVRIAGNRRCELEVKIAKQGKREYFAGLIRFAEDGTMTHVDFAPTDAVGYSVDKVVGQVAWNLFLRAPSSGGYCRVFKNLWCEEYEQCRVSYGYKGSVAAGSSYFDIEAVKGDIVLFNCRNFHQVEQSAGEDRVTAGSFLGKLPNDKYVLWS